MLWRSSWPRDRTEVSRIAGRCFTTWATRDTFYVKKQPIIVAYAKWSEKAMSPHASTLAWKTHGRRSLVGCSPWGREESDTTERLHFPFSLSCIGEGNGNPLQCSCLENPKDGGAWWAAIYGVTQSRTQLKRPSSSSDYSRDYLTTIHPTLWGRHLTPILQGS